MSVRDPEIGELGHGLWEALSGILPDDDWYHIRDEDVWGLVQLELSGLSDALNVLKRHGKIDWRKGGKGYSRSVRVLYRCPVSKTMRDRIDFFRARREPRPAPRRCLTCRTRFRPTHRTNFRCEVCNGTPSEGGDWMSGELL